MVFERGHDMSNDVYRLGHWRFLSQVLLCPHPLSQSWTKKPRKAKMAGAFRTWTSSCRWRKWWSRLTNGKSKEKTTCHSLLVFYVISIHFNCLSPGKFILLQPLNQGIRSSVAKCLTQKHPPKHPPSAGRASVGWPYGMDHRRQNPWAHPQQNDTQTWPLNQPTGKHKQTCFEFSLHEGDGWWKSWFSDQMIFKLILPTMLCWCQPPSKAGPQKKTHAQPSSILEDCNCSQNRDIDTTSIVAQGTLGLFWQPVCCAAGRWIQPKYSSIHRKPVTQTQKLSEKIAEGETSLLDSWTLGQVLLSSSTGLKEHLQCHIFLMPLMHVQTNTAWTDTRHWLSWPCLQRNIICCPIFELPDWMRCILPFRVLLCHDAPFDTIRMAHRGTIVPGMIMLPILPTTSWNRLRWLRCHCLQRFVAKRFSSWLRMIEDSPCRWGNKWKSFKNYPTGFQLKMHKCMKTLAKIKKVKT